MLEDKIQRESIHLSKRSLWWRFPFCRKYKGPVRSLSFEQVFWIDTCIYGWYKLKSCVCIDRSSSTILHKSTIYFPAFARRFQCLRLAGYPMFGTVAGNLVILVHCRLNHDTPGIVCKFLLATMCIFPVYVRGVAVASAWGTDDALHSDLIGPLFQIALSVIRWLCRIHVLPNEGCEGGWTGNHYGYQVNQLHSQSNGLRESLYLLSIPV